MVVIDEQTTVDNVEAERLLGALFGGVEQDPFPYYDALRELGDGIHRVDVMGAVLLTRYDDIRKVGSDPRTFSSELFELTGPGIHDPEDPEHRRFIETASRLFMFADPPRHTQVRSTFRHAFTPDAVRRWRGIVEDIADEVLARFEPGQEIDLMGALASEVPVAVIAQILGVPRDTWQHFRDWSFAYASTFDPMVQGERRDQAIRTSLILFDYLSELIDERRADPCDDLISHMLSTETFDGDTLEKTDLIAQVALLLVAGNETTTNLVGNGVTLLMAHPDANSDLRAEPALLPGAVEEMLRYDPPLHLAGRKVTTEVTLGDHTLPLGTVVLTCIPAANRDPRAFPNASEFDIHRTDNKHLAFFHGIHYCVGAPLARLEGTVILDKLLHAFPDIRAGNARPVRRTLNVASRGWESRPVIL
ncbi:cytochrome P450 [Mycolicibacterium hippocampi]|uniref:cytochrome P450 n=1 Tax=Mycolicibacterium hippocampi TaxID=659824 RepID=UPI001F2E410C|nr:cytochrome P450 [Mycolicibacterium hippocampi]